ncbi:immunity 49 family protein [Streptomyces sp. JNUCC 64]
MGQAQVPAVLDDATNRIVRLVISSSKAGRMTASVWSSISDEFLDYLGALSVADPSLDSPEARAVLEAAAESAAGAVQFAAYWPHVSFSVFLDYVNFGMGYEPGEGEPDEDGPEGVTAGGWLDAFCLAVLTDRTRRHGEAFHFAREDDRRARRGEPLAELIHGLMVYVLDDLDDEDAPYPPSADHKRAALDEALARVRAREEAGSSPAGEHPHTIALAALRALAAGDRAGFGECLTRLLTAPGVRPGPGGGPASLLPLLPLALAALGYRNEGWWPPLETDYLPRALVTGFEGAGPRVGAYGRDRRPDAVAELAVRHLVVDRPGDGTGPGTDGERLPRHSRWRADGRPLDAGAWQRAMAHALIDGNREELAPLVVDGERALEGDPSAFAAYRRALLAYLRADDPVPAVDEALAVQERSRDWGFAMPPIVLLSQLAEGDEESFNLALADALERHRDHYRVADRPRDPDAALDLDVLALACHARRHRGWAIRVDSPYLPSARPAARAPLSSG